MPIAAVVQLACSVAEIRGDPSLRALRLASRQAMRAPCIEEPNGDQDHAPGEAHAHENARLLSDCPLEQGVEQGEAPRHTLG